MKDNIKFKKCYKRKEYYFKVNDITYAIIYNPYIPGKVERPWRIIFNDLKFNTKYLKDAKLKVIRLFNKS
jgi:RNAse (barnase) inhibitor barstar